MVEASSNKVQRLLDRAALFIENNQIDKFFQILDEIDSIIFGEYDILRLPIF